MEDNIYAIISSGGKQYKVEENKDIIIEKIDGEEGEKVTLPDVNMISDGGKVSIGNPKLANAEVEATIKKQIKGDKVIAFKHKAKKRYSRKIGHRQLLTILHLDKIKVG